jgi:hypothetical protein
MKDFRLAAQNVNVCGGFVQFLKCEILMSIKRRLKIVNTRKDDDGFEYLRN